MVRRSFAKPSEVEEPGDRPSLEKVLDHYCVQYIPKSRQMIRCPIHGDEKTPSCSLDLDKGLMHCHSCGFGGDVWTLIEQLEGTDFDGARAFTAALGLTAGSSGGGSGERRRRTPGLVGGGKPYRPRWRGR